MKSKWMISEFTTLGLLAYSLLLLIALSSSFVRRSIPRVAIALLVLVPWSVSLLAGALCGTAQILTNCIELRIMNNTDIAIGYFDMSDNGRECVYHDKVPPECKEYFPDIKECENTYRRQLNQYDIDVHHFGLGSNINCREYVHYLDQDCTNITPGTKCMRAVDKYNRKCTGHLTCTGFADCDPEKLPTSSLARA